MKTVTKKEDFTCIVYDEELLKKNITSIQFNLLLCFLILPIHISEMYNRNWIYVYIVFCIFFIMDYNNQIPFLKIGSKIKIVIYNDRIEIVRGKNHIHLYREIKNIEYKTKKYGPKDYYLLKITKTNKKVYKYELGLVEEEILEIFGIIKNNYEEWRIKNYEDCNREN